MAVLLEYKWQEGNLANLTGTGGRRTSDASDSHSQSSSMSTDSSDEMDIQQELKNIENVISLTRANIDSLNAKFAGLQNPPAMYLKEYEDLTSKLHELEAEERRLLDQLSNGRETPVNDYDDGYKIETFSSQFDSLKRPRFDIFRIQLVDRVVSSTAVAISLIGLWMAIVIDIQFM